MRLHRQEEHYHTSCTDCASIAEEAASNPGAPFRGHSRGLRRRHLQGNGTSALTRSGLTRFSCEAVQLRHAAAFFHASTRTRLQGHRIPTPARRSTMQGLAAGLRARLRDPRVPKGWVDIGESQRDCALGSVTRGSRKTAVDKRVVAAGLRASPVTVPRCDPRVPNGLC